MSLRLFVANVEALRQTWLLRDNFLTNIHDALSSLKTELKISKENSLYLHENYQIRSFFTNPASPMQPVILCIHSAFVAALNEYSHLPHYVFVIPDNDLVKPLIGCKAETTNLITENLEWLIKNIAKDLMRRREDLKDERMGAVPLELTRIIWVKMLVRPFTKDKNLEAIWKLIHKFNGALEQLLENESYMHILEIEDAEELKYFNKWGDLTPQGKNHFWWNISKQLNLFDFRKINLKVAVTNTYQEDRRKLDTRDMRTPSPCNTKQKKPKVQKSSFWNKELSVFKKKARSFHTNHQHSKARKKLPFPPRKRIGLDEYHQHHRR